MISLSTCGRPRIYITNIIAIPLIHMTSDVVASNRTLKRGEPTEPETGSSRRVYYYTHNIFGILTTEYHVYGKHDTYIRGHPANATLFSWQSIQCNKNCLMYVICARKSPNFAQLEFKIFFFQTFIFNHIFFVLIIWFIIAFPGNMNNNTVIKFSNFQLVMNAYSFDSLIWIDHRYTLFLDCYWCQ